MDLANALEPFAYAFFQKGFLVAGLCTSPFAA
jgi:hypothetical protein